MRKRTQKTLVILTALMVATMLLFTGCGSVEVSSSKSSSESETETVEDQGGNKHEVTHEVVTEDGETTEYYKNVVFEVDNELEEEVCEFYLKNSDSDDWGENLFDGSEPITLAKGDVAYGFELSYSTANPTVDIMVHTTDDGEITFENLDLTSLNGALQFTMTLNFDAESEAYSLDVE